MGGGGGSAAATTEVQADPEFTGQMRNFVMGQPDMVQQQLNMAGLGGMIDPTQFQATNVPVFKNPAEIELYLKSLGENVAAADSTSSANSATTTSQESSTNRIPIGW
jgi:hypothetical protein